jgi:DUF917 family protein
MDDERRLLDAQDIELIALGAGVLGSGGGGSTYLGRLLALDAVRRGQSITLCAPRTIATGALVIAVAQVGAPIVLAERLARGEEAAQACAALEAHLGEAAAAVACYEIGGINSMIPLLVAARRGVPLLNADAMGRAFPGLHQDTLSIYGSAPPVAICDDEGNAAVYHAADAAATERLGRALTTAMGGLAHLARPVPRDVPLDRALIPGSYSRAHAIGAALRRAQQRGDLAGIDLAHAGGDVLFAGGVQIVERPAPDDPIRGVVSIAAQGNGFRGTARIAFQTEYLLVWQEGTLRAATPDAIAVLDEETGDPIGTDALHVGLRVVVLRLAADRRLTTERALRAVGPAAFGYDVEYRA